MSRYWRCVFAKYSVGKAVKRQRESFRSSFMLNERGRHFADRSPMLSARSRSHPACAPPRISACRSDHAFPSVSVRTLRACSPSRRAAPGSPGPSSARGSAHPRASRDRRGASSGGRRSISPPRRGSPPPPTALSAAFPTRRAGRARSGRPAPAGRSPRRLTRPLCDSRSHSRTALARRGRAGRRAAA